MYQITMNFLSIKSKAASKDFTPQELSDQSFLFVKLFIKYGVIESLKDQIELNDMLACERHLNNLAYKLSTFLWSNTDLTSISLVLSNRLEDLWRNHPNYYQDLPKKVAEAIVSNFKKRFLEYYISINVNRRFSELAFTDHICKEHQEATEVIIDADNHSDLSKIFDKTKINEEQKAKIIKFAQEKEQKESQSKLQTEGQTKTLHSKRAARFKLLQNHLMRSKINDLAPSLSNALKYITRRVINATLSYPQKNHKNDINIPNILILPMEIQSKLSTLGALFTKALSKSNPKSHANFVIANLKIIASDKVRDGTHSREVINIPIKSHKNSIFSMGTLLSQIGLENAAINIQKRFKAGLSYFKKNNKYILEEVEKTEVNYKDEKNYYRDFHHSEQALCEYLKSKECINYILDQLKKQKIMPGHKIYAVILDIFSQNDLCTRCEIAIGGMLNSNSDEFLASLEKALANARYFIPKKNQGVKMVVRVISEKDYAGNPSGYNICHHQLETTQIKNLHGEIIASRTESLKNSSMIRDYSNSKTKLELYSNYTLFSSSKEQSLGNIHREVNSIVTQPIEISSSLNQSKRKL